MKNKLAGAIIGSILFISTAFAVDYSTMSTEELSRLRGTMQNATVEERNAFRQEWQKRMQNMTQEERQRYLGSPQGAGQGQMQRGSGNAPCGAGRGRGGGR